MVSDVTNAIIYTSILDNFIIGLLAHQLFSTTHTTRAEHGVRAFPFHATAGNTLGIVREVKKGPFVLRLDGELHRGVVASRRHQHKHSQDEDTDEHQRVAVGLVKVEHFLILYV